MISISNENFPQKKNNSNHKLTFSELSECIKNNNSEPLISYLNNSNNSINIKNSSNETLLHVSAKNSKKNFSELLLSYGINPNLQNNNLQIPLHLIVINKNIEMLKIFKDFNSDFNNIKDIYNKTVYDYVIQNGNEYKKIFDDIFLNNSNDNSSVKIISPENQIFTESDFKKLNLNDNNNNNINTFDNEMNKNFIEQNYNSNKEIIKNIITQTIKKVNVENSNNTFNNNLSENYNINTSNENNNDNLNNNNSDIFLNSLSKKSFNNNKTINNSNKSNNNINISNINPINDTSEMNPLDLINQVITTNSNIFSELNSRQNTQNNVNNNNAMNNFNLKTDENILTDMNYSKSKSNEISSSKKSNSNNFFDNKENKIIEKNINDNNNINNEIELYDSNNNNLKLNDNSSNYNSNNNNNMIRYNNLVYNNSTIETRTTTHGKNTNKNFMKKFTKINSNNINNNVTENYSTFNTNILNNNINNNNKNFNNNLHKKKSSILTEYAYKLNNQNIPYLNNTFNVREKNNSIQSKNNNNYNQNNNNYILNTNNYNNDINYFNNNQMKNENNKSNNYINININNDIDDNNNDYYDYNNNNNNNYNNNTNEEIFFIDSPSKEELLKFHDWLSSCELLSYYNILLSNNIYEIDKIILGIKKKEINVSYNDIEDIGIKKPGHILRFLLKIEIEIGNIDSKISEFILNVFDNNNNKNSFIQLSNSNLNYCCYYENNNEYNNENDVEKFLRKNGLINFKDNFIHNGFDSIAFIILQMFSKYEFNDEFLIEYLHIYNENNRKKILKILYLEKNKICKYLNISPSKFGNNNNFYETTINENSNICCLIF